MFSKTDHAVVHEKPKAVHVAWARGVLTQEWENLGSMHAGGATGIHCIPPILCQMLMNFLFWPLPHSGGNFECIYREKINSTNSRAYATALCLSSLHYFNV